MIWHIAWRELRSLFLSPLAWTILAVMQFILAWIFFAQMETFFVLQPQLAVIDGAPGATDLIVAPLFSSASVLLLMICPLMTMRLIAEERRSGTLNLLLSSPVSMTEIVLGKYLGIILFLFILVLQISLMPLSLLMGTEIDMGKLAAGILGQMLLLASFAAAGLYLSSLTTNPVIAAISTFGLLIMLWIIDAAANSGANAGNQSSEFFNYMSLIQHNTPMLRGIINSSDLAYFVLFIITFISLSIRQLDSQRLQK
ncbi:MAG: ABC transporter permease subunit [Gammaproteobacteria bacterium]|nr:ABC transporter permease subunit [Gammaproteobacteria bacterium]MDH5736377.1 ABC transporter permease subunit [Gammaproteobacteria bacterium]